MVNETAVVTRADCPRPGLYDLVLHCPAAARNASPGQFLNVFCGGDTFLRRPISICCREGEYIRIIAEDRGRGTHLLGELSAGDRLDILGPLGHGFPDIGGRILLIGGGIGTPPLYFPAFLAPGKCDAVLGFRTGALLMLENDFRAVCGETIVATDDGSMGFHGFAADAARPLIEKNKYAAIFSCGPRPMLKSAAALGEEYGIPCYVSMEERMGCGVGACLVCACKTKKDGHEHYSHVCSDGPVFNAKEVVW